MAKWAKSLQVARFIPVFASDWDICKVTEIYVFVLVGFGPVFGRCWVVVLSKVSPGPFPSAPA